MINEIRESLLSTANGNTISWYILPAVDRSIIHSQLVTAVGGDDTITRERYRHVRGVDVFDERASTLRSTRFAL